MSNNIEGQESRFNIARDSSCVSDTNISWDFKEKIKDFLKEESKILYFGDAKFLLSLHHKSELISAIADNEAEREWLVPSGINTQIEDGGILPFNDNSFDIVINRHREYDISYIKKVLKKGGYFITEQSCKKRASYFNLENETQRLEQNGYRIMYRKQEYIKENGVEFKKFVLIARLVSI